MSSATHIIDALGGTSAVARELAVGTSVVHGWKQYNTIPAWRQSDIIGLAIKLGVALSSSDFPTPDERIARPRKAA